MEEGTGDHPWPFPSFSSKLPPIGSFGRSSAESSSMDSHLQQQRGFLYSEPNPDAVICSQEKPVAGHFDSISTILPHKQGPCPIDPVMKTTNHRRPAEVPSFSVESSVCSTPFGPPRSLCHLPPALPTRRRFYEPPQNSVSYNVEFAEEQHTGNYFSQISQSSQESECCPLRGEYALQSDIPWGSPGYHIHYSNPQPAVTSVPYYNHPQVFYHQPQIMVSVEAVQKEKSRSSTAKTKNTRKKGKKDDCSEDEKEEETMEIQKGKGKKLRTAEDREKNRVSQANSRKRKCDEKDTLYETIAVAHDMCNYTRISFMGKISEIINSVDNSNEELKRKLIAYRDNDLKNGFTEIRRILSPDDYNWSLDGNSDWNQRMDPKILNEIRTSFGHKKMLVNARKEEKRLKQLEMERELQLQIDQIKEKEKEDYLRKMEENILREQIIEEKLLASCNSSEASHSQQ